MHLFLLAYAHGKRAELFIHLTLLLWTPTVVCRLLPSLLDDHFAYLGKFVFKSGDLIRQLSCVGVWRVLVEESELRF